MPALLVPRGDAPLCANDGDGADAIATAAIKTMADILVIGASPSMIQPVRACRVPEETRGAVERNEEHMRKLIAFDDDTAAKLKQLARDRMATFQERPSPIS